MNYRSDSLEKKAWEKVNELKRDYVIDILTAERLHDIFVYLMLAQASKNPRGIEMQQNALRNVLRNCSVINKPATVPMIPHGMNAPKVAAYA